MNHLAAVRGAVKVWLAKFPLSGSRISTALQLV